MSYVVFAPSALAVPISAVSLASGATADKMGVRLAWRRGTDVTLEATDGHIALFYTFVPSELADCTGDGDVRLAVSARVRALAPLTSLTVYHRAMVEGNEQALALAGISRLDEERFGSFPPLRARLATAFGAPPSSVSSIGVSAQLMDRVMEAFRRTLPKSKLKDRVAEHPLRFEFRGDGEPIRVRPLHANMPKLEAVIMPAKL